MAAVMVLVVTFATLAMLLIWLGWLDRRERRRQREWYRQYFHGGGLIRALMRNWRSQPRLTDQRSRRDEG